MPRVDACSEIVEQLGRHDGVAVAVDEQRRAGELPEQVHGVDWGPRSELAEQGLAREEQHRCRNVAAEARGEPGQRAAGAVTPQADPPRVNARRGSHGVHGPGQVTCAAGEVQAPDVLDHLGEVVIGLDVARPLAVVVVGHRGRIAEAGEPLLDPLDERVDAVGLRADHDAGMRSQPVGHGDAERRGLRVPSHRRHASTCSVHAAPAVKLGLIASAYSLCDPQNVPASDQGPSVNGRPSSPCCRRFGR